ncbi:MAG TPA: IS1595 family transposase [Sphingomicrobium sp.]|nr:IS1595 family transposase [Sphingomicrobium sp.]
MESLLNAAHFANEDAAITYVESRLWPNGPVCPHCGTVGEASRSKGKTTRRGLWNCRACRKPFTVKIGTVFESSHVPLHIWLQVIYLFCSSKKGFATRQIQRTLGCSMKTAWFLGHRVRAAMTELGIEASEQLGGEGKMVEIDETYVGGLEKNKHRSKRKHVGTGGAGKEAVFSLVERGGKVRSHHVPNVTAVTLRPILKAHVHEATFVMTDEGATDKSIGRDFKKHGMVNHGLGEYVRGDIHTNTVEGYFSIFKRGIYGCYFHVSEAHLHRYLAEFDFRYNNRIALGIDDLARADRALIGAKGKRLTYRTARGSGASAAPF